MMGAGHHFAITQRLITLPLPPPFTALSLFPKPHIHLLFHGQLYAQVHTHPHPQSVRRADLFSLSVF